MNQTLECNNDDPYYPGGIRCTFSSLNFRNAWLGCRDGYVDPNTGECVSSCGSGRYG